MTDTTVTLDENASRYEIRVGETLAGFAEFRRLPGEILFTHTEIDPAFSGKGLGGVLAAEALADAVASGNRIVPYCPYIARYLKTNEVVGAEIRWPQVPGQ